MIFPITHEDMSSRRWPFLTAGLIFACLVSLLALIPARNASQHDMVRALNVAVRYYHAHPYLAQCPHSDDDSLPELPPLDELEVDEDEDPADTLGALRGRVPDDTKKAEQAQLDAYCADLRATLAASPVRRFGFVPTRPLSAGLFTHMFMHGGWEHLIFNMWFLWLCGCNLEDRWGRAVFLAFYVVAGFAGAIGHFLVHPTSNIPLIGASGAIAGAMGAFLVSFATTKIRFFWIMFFRWGTFTAPAYIMLPLWLLSQVFWGIAGLGDGVAYFAHVGGFVFGAVAAYGLQRTGLEKKLDDAVEQSVTTSQDPRILRAGELIDQHGFAEAIHILEAVAREKPASIDAQLELLRASKGALDRTRESAAYGRLIQLYFETGHAQTALDMYDEAEAVDAIGEIRPGLRFRVAEQLAERRLHPRAVRAFASVYRDGLVDLTTVRAVVAHARVAAEMGRTDEARNLLRMARESPFCPRELDTQIDAELARLGEKELPL